MGIISCLFCHYFNVELAKCILLVSIRFDKSILYFLKSFINDHLVFLKKVNPKQLLKEYVGVGDLLLFLVLALSLPYYVFLPFQIASLIIGMVLGVLLFKNRTVPLAGIQASLLVLMFGATQVFHLPMWKLEYLLL